MPSLAPDAPDREASVPSFPLHEADKAALDEQLEGTRITKKVTPVPSTSILNGGCMKMMCFRINHYIHKICSSILTDASRRVGFILR